LSIDRSNVAKIQLEHFYKNQVAECADRHARRLQLEEQIVKENWSEEKKHRQLVSHGKKESDFLRLKRTRLGADDFETLKVIGKGAFGEVSESFELFFDFNFFNKKKILTNIKNKINIIINILYNLIY